ncbi:helix-turn-helix domain-containing protein [Mycobacterium sp. ENV421]|uniref:helix-turn-helix domain-containing protein n=1 Tax=Mycobacterium sp. ENV421 TaxID=1213407 RepID=UPI000C9BDD64|nr:helix-turn-helix domain-containing protein [Mycobacterium sp. ENV421]PND54269.1 helix-turn-helix domain-containing protein [Mycobacterium sp. ENV421]
MKDAFHGSAHTCVGPDTAHRGQHIHVHRPYRGCSKAVPRRGVAHTAPQWILRAGGHCLDNVPRVALQVDAPWAAIPCWSGRARKWAHITVPKAYQERYETHVRPAMPGNPVSLKALVTVAEARASFADHRTGRECRPTNARLAEMTGLSVRTVQRASTTLRLLGVATEVMRGRQRTRSERYASWRVGDRGRGWASVWALHDNRFQQLSPHPGGSHLIHKTSPKKSLTTHHQRESAGRSAAPRRQRLDSLGLALANAWLADEQSPPWARRYRTGTAWAAVLARPAHHGWTPRDLNQLITDWIGTGHWVPDSPHKPIGLLGAMLASHGNFEERPAALDVAREQEELAAARRRVERQFAEREKAERAREVGRAALDGGGRAAARRALDEIVARRRRGGGAPR